MLINEKEIAFLTLSAVRGDERMKELYPLVKQLRPDLTYDEWVAQDRVMAEATGYDGFVLTEGERVIGFISFEILFRLSFGGKFLYIADLVIDENERGKGYGRQLMQKAEEIAKREKASVIVLESGIQRVEAHRFYQRLGYKVTSHSFRKAL